MLEQAESSRARLQLPRAVPDGRIDPFWKLVSGFDRRQRLLQKYLKAD